MQKGNSPLSGRPRGNGKESLYLDNWQKKAFMNKHINRLANGVDTVNKSRCESFVHNIRNRNNNFITVRNASWDSDMTLNSSLDRKGRAEGYDRYESTLRLKHTSTPLSTNLSKQEKCLSNRTNQHNSLLLCATSKLWTLHLKGMQTITKYLTKLVHFHPRLNNCHRVWVPNSIWKGIPELGGFIRRWSCPCWSSQHLAIWVSVKVHSKKWVHRGIRFHV